MASGKAPELAIASWRISLPIVCLFMLPWAFFDGMWIAAAKSICLGDPDHFDSVWLHYGTVVCTKGGDFGSMVTLATMYFGCTWY